MLFSSLWKQPLLLTLLVAAVLLAVLTVAAYFYARRPRRGTTEWMKPSDTPPLATLAMQSLRFSDAAFAVLAGLGAALLRLLYLCLHYRIFSRENPMAVLSAASGTFLAQLIPCLLIAAGLYLLLRTMLGKPLPALCAAIVGAVLLAHAPSSAAALAFSLLFLYFWVCAPAVAPLFFHAFWLVLSGALYAAALLYCWQTAWLAPIYLAAYVYAQIFRWRGGNPERRVGKLVLSLLLSALSFALCAIALWAAYVALSGRMDGGVNLLRSFRFYADLLPVLGEKLGDLFVPLAFQSTIVVGDVFVFACGVASCVCVLHGAIKLRESRCLLILLLQIPFVLAWLLGGVYLLSLSLLLPVCWVWNTYSTRGHNAFTLVSAAVLFLCYGATTFI